MTTTPSICYHPIWDGMQPPRPASPSAQGGIPTRAFRYCEALRMASGAGHYLHAPTEFYLVWDGKQIMSSLDGENWALLSDSLMHPSDPDHWMATAPEDIKWACPTMLTALPEPGLVQIATGLIATAQPGWGLFLMPPVNFELPYPMVQWVGVVDPSAYAGSLFVNFRITKTDQPFKIYSDRPLTQAVPMRMADLRPYIQHDMSLQPMSDERRPRTAKRPAQMPPPSVRWIPHSSLSEPAQRPAR